MRRKWGRAFTVRGGWSPPKRVPRRWGGPRWKPRSSSSSGSSGGSYGKGWTPRRPRRRLKRKQLLILTALLLSFAVFESFNFFDQKLKEPLFFLAKIQVRQMAMEAINTAIKQEVTDNADPDSLIRWKTDSQGKMSGFLIDYKEQRKITSQTIQTVERVLQEQQNVPEKIPIGHALNSPLLSAFGPRVAVSFHPASAVLAEVGTRQTEAGINMLLIEVFIKIHTEIAVVVPFDQEPDVLETEIPLSYALVVGNVPSYYYDGSGKPVGNGASSAPPIAIPEPEPPAQPAH